jgi:hypothetical protein
MLEHTELSEATAPVFALPYLRGFAKAAPLRRLRETRAKLKNNISRNEINAKDQTTRKRENGSSKFHKKNISRLLS